MISGGSMRARPWPWRHAPLAAGGTSAAAARDTASELRRAPARPCQPLTVAARQAPSDQRRRRRRRQSHVQSSPAAVSYICHSPLGSGRGAEIADSESVCVRVRVSVCGLVHQPSGAAGTSADLLGGLSGHARGACCPHAGKCKDWAVGPQQLGRSPRY